MSLSNKLSKKLINMLSAQLSKKESNVASVLGKGCAMQCGFKEGYLRGKCKLKPCASGMWSQEKMVAANGALLLHLPLQNHMLVDEDATACAGCRGAWRLSRRIRHAHVPLVHHGSCAGAGEGRARSG